LQAISGVFVINEMGFIHFGSVVAASVKVGNIVVIFAVIFV
jgi:hypothetical protein